MNKDEQEVTPENEDQDLSGGTDPELEVSEGEEGTGEPSDDGQQKNFDPEQYVESLELPDDQKKALRDSILRQKDYTLKTQELASKRKLIEQWSPILNKLAADRKLFDLVNGYGSQDQGQGEDQADELPQDPREYAEYVKRETIQEIQNNMAIERDLAQAVKVDPRLEGSEPHEVNFQRIIAGIVAQDSDFIAGAKSYTQAVQEAVGWYDGEFYKGVEQNVHSSLQKKVQDKRMVTPRSSSPVTTKSSSTGSSMHDSFKEAMEELGMA